MQSSASAGLPAPWAQHDVGSIKVPGFTLFDGSTFRLEAAGADIGGDGDQLQFAYVPLNGDGSITARFVPQVPSQFAKIGVMIRETLAADSAQASLLINPEVAESVEVPKWNICLFTRRRGRENDGCRQE